MLTRRIIEVRLHAGVGGHSRQPHSRGFWISVYLASMQEPLILFAVEDFCLYSPSSLYNHTNNNLNTNTVQPYQQQPQHKSSLQLSSNTSFLIDYELKCWRSPQDTFVTLGLNLYECLSTFKQFMHAKHALSFASLLIATYEIRNVVQWNLWIKDTLGAELFSCFRRLSGERFTIYNHIKEL